MAIDWSQVQDGLGSAEAVPALVEALSASRRARREKAFVVLSDERLVHQGWRSAAAPLAVPLLVDALRARKHPGRALVLSTLAHIAVGAPSLQAREADARSIAALATDAGIDGRAYRAVRDAADAIALHVDASDPPTRAHAAATLAFVAPERAATALRDRLVREDDEPTLASMLVTLGLANRLVGVGTIPVLAGTSELVLTAHAIARASCGERASASEIAPGLSAPLADLQTALGALGELAIGAALALGEPGRALLAGALETASTERKAHLAHAVVRAAFPDASDGVYAPLVPSTSFTPAALESVRLVVAASPSNLWGPIDVLRSVGLTSWRPDLLRFVGLAPGGLLEERVAWRGAEAEVVVALDALARGHAEENEVRGVLEERFAPEVLVDLAMHAAGNAYQLHTRPAWSPERAVAFASTLVRDPRVWPRVREHIAAFEAVPYWGRWVLLDAAHRIGEGDVDLAPLLHALAPTPRGELVTILRTAVATAPPAVRDALAASVALPDLVHPVTSQLGAWNLLDLAADRAAAARRAAGAVARWTPAQASATQVHPRDAAERVLAALHPESRAPIEEALPTATEHGRSILAPLLAPS